MKSTLRHILCVARRELGEYFGSPVFWVVAALFHLIVGSFFLQILVDMMEHVIDPYKRSALQGELNLSQFVLRNVFDVANFLLIFIVPILTMRLVAEERRSGMYELLVATPARDWALLGGKALAAYLTTLALVASVLLYPLMTARLGAIEWGMVAAGMIGLAFLAAAYVALGIFASSLTDNPIIAAVIALSGLLFFTFLAYMGPNDSSWLGNAMRGFSFGLREREFFAGVLRGEDIVYMLLFALFFLFATARVLESRRWRL